MIYRLLTSILLINFLIINTVHAVGMGGNNEYFYYRSNLNTESCKESLSDMCGTFSGVDTRDCTISSTDCPPTSPGSINYTVGHTGTCQFIDYWGQTKSEFRTWFTYGNQAYFHRESITCAASHHLKLVGCSATCEPDNSCEPGFHSEYGQCVPDEDKCASKKDQKVSALSVCATVSCPSNYHLANSGGVIACVNSNGDEAPSQYVFDGYSNSIVKDGCGATLDPSFTQKEMEPLVKGSATGSSTNGYCPADYIYTGTSASGEDAPSDLKSLSGVGVLPSTENASCPPNYIHGQSGSAGQYVCVPEGFGGTGTSNDCPAKQIKNNSGVCVPYALAGTGCAHGLVKNSSGVCSAVSSGTGSGSGSGTGNGSGSGSGSGSGNSGSLPGVCESSVPDDIDCQGGGQAGGTCDPTKSICDGDGQASTGSITKPTKIENTVTKSWWTPKYPNGITGIWQSHQTEMNNTPFIQSLNQFKAGIPNTGSCPAFALSLGQYSGSISPPCIIWPFLRAVFLFSTMMLCRRIVFGG